MPKIPSKQLNVISLDTETTGLDLRHGAKPYLVTTCNLDGENTWWEWAVDPLTRQPQVIDKELRQIQQVIDDADLLILQNPKFDYIALQIIFDGKLRWDWDKVRDTLLGGHLLASNQPHDLTTMLMVYLRANVKPYDDRMKQATQEARRWVKSKYPEWRLAHRDLPEMPSAKDSVWKYDAWLPRLLADELDKPEWETVTSEYANSDSTGTIALWQKQEKLLHERGLWKIYEERLKLLPMLLPWKSVG